MPLLFHNYAAISFRPTEKKAKAVNNYAAKDRARWYQAEICGKLVLVTEPLHVTDLCQDAHGSDDSYSRNSPEQVVPAFVPFCLAHLAQLARCFQQGTSNTTTCLMRRSHHFFSSFCIHFSVKVRK